jgi:transposase
VTRAVTDAERVPVNLSVLSEQRRRQILAAVLAADSTLTTARVETALAAVVRHPAALRSSQANHALIEEAGIGFVGSLPPSDHTGLLAIPASGYTRVDDKRYPGVTCVDTTVTALGVTRRAVLTHSPTLHAAQSRGFDQTLAKARRQLLDLQATLDRGHTRRGRVAVESEIAAICTPRWVSQVLTTTLTGETPAQLRLTFHTDTDARSRLEAKLFGKRILFTNRDDWPVADVVAAYRSQSEVESGFR